MDAVSMGGVKMPEMKALKPKMIAIIQNQSEPEFRNRKMPAR